MLREKGLLWKKKSGDRYVSYIVLKCRVWDFFSSIKKFPDYFRYNTNHFENLEQIYVCALPEIEFSEYFSETKAIYF